MLSNISELLNFASKQSCIYGWDANSQECLIRRFCDSLPLQIRMNIIYIIVADILISMLAAWFLDHGYRAFADKYKDSEIGFIKSFAYRLQFPKDRIEYMLWIKERLEMLLIGALMLCFIYMGL